MERRTFLKAAAGVGGSLAVGGSLWRAVASPVPGVPEIAPTPGIYGDLADPDGNGLRLPAGFVSRVVARSGEDVAGYTWHEAPDGGACFADAKAGWIYVSNAELDGNGGVGALRFAADGSVLSAYRILDGTNRNCAGGATPWGTWLSCEEMALGYVYETFPAGGKPAIRRDVMGRFKHEAAAVDPVRGCVYLTEDEDDGCFYRFVPTIWPVLDVGRLEVLCGGGPASGAMRWQQVPDPSGATAPTRDQVPGAARFDGGEGCVYGADTVWFTTKGDERVWRLDCTRNDLDLAYDSSMFDGPSPLVGPDNLTRSQTGDIFVAEDAGRMEICMISPSGAVSSFLRVLGQPESEITGPAFSPDGRRLYFSSQRGTSGKDSGGITYEVTGPFRDLVPQAS